MKNKKIVNKERISRLREYIDSAPEYSLKSFLEEKDLLKDYKVQGRNILIECPYHEDAYPSFSVDLEREFYHCLSCGCRGKKYDLIIEYAQKVENINLSYYSLLENYVRKDDKLKRIIGSNRIYDVIEEKIDNLENFKVKRYSLDEVLSYSEKEPQSMPELLKLIKKTPSMDNDDLVYAISLLQLNISVEEVYDIMFVNRNKSKTLNTAGRYTGVSLNDILSGGN